MGGARLDQGRALFRHFSPEFIELLPLARRIGNGLEGLSGAFALGLGLRQIGFRLGDGVFHGLQAALGRR
jgi:hypothetical protein